jgi:hypothetical protein
MSLYVVGGRLALPVKQLPAPEIRQNRQKAYIRVNSHDIEQNKASTLNRKLFVFAVAHDVQFRIKFTELLLKFSNLNFSSSSHSAAGSYSLTPRFSRAALCIGCKRLLGGIYDPGRQPQFASNSHRKGKLLAPLSEWLNHEEPIERSNIRSAQ